MKTFFEDQIRNLDLHGVRHHEVEVMVEDYVLKYQDELPLVVICGNSAKMIEIVSKALSGLSVDFEETRYGRIRINALQ